MHLYACSRSGASLDFPQPKLPSKVSFAKLDISSSASISSLASNIASADGHLDVLINNAGTNDTGSWASRFSAAEVVDVNYGGTRDVCLGLLPLLRKHAGSEARIVNLSSTGSALHHYSDKVKAQFRNPELTLEELDALAMKFKAAKEGGTAREEGFGGANGYAFSKAAINSLTQILARENAGHGVVVNACCPGWVDTEMGNIMGKPGKTTEEGARIPFRLAVGDIEGQTGKYWGNPGVSDKGEGEVRPW